MNAGLLLPRLRSSRFGFWAGAVAWVLIAAVTLFGAHGCTPKAYQTHLAKKVEAALRAGGHEGVTVTMDGQQAILGGVVSTEEAKAAAALAALKAAGPGGAWLGGVVKVRANDLVVGAPISPFTWGAEREGDGVRLKGYAPSETARARLISRSKELFRGAVTDTMLVRAGAPAEGDWTAVAEGALGQLATLSKGEARLNDARLTIFGEADAATVAAVQAFYANPLGGPYRAIVDVTAPGAGLGIPELAGVDLQNAEAGDCNKAFGAIMARNVINFDTGSAVVSASSQQTLSNLAKVARRCEKYRVEISGHTDALGDRAMNVKLSEDRARAVRDYLVGEGVAVDRLTYAGFGPDRPRASNRTEPGRAANRRIEFEVKS